VLALGSAGEVEGGEGGGVVLDELDELAGGDGEAFGGAGGVEGVIVEDVEGLGEEGGEVVVFGVAGDGAAAEAGTPECGGGGFGAEEIHASQARGWDAVLGGEEEAEAEEGDGFVFGLAAAFAGVCGEGGWEVGDGDEGFDFVAVLTAGAAGAATGEGAGLEEFGVVECGGVWPAIDHGGWGGGGSGGGGGDGGEGEGV
jgi:hypothetical protein